MPQPLGEQPSLPVRRAFVVQFRAEAKLTQGHFTGRVEHVLSDQALKFASLEELVGSLPILWARNSNHADHKVRER